MVPFFVMTTTVCELTYLVEALTLQTASGHREVHEGYSGADVRREFHLGKNTNAHTITNSTYNEITLKHASTTLGYGVIIKL